MKSNALLFFQSNFSKNHEQQDSVKPDDPLFDDITQTIPESSKKFDQREYDTFSFNTQLIPFNLFSSQFNFDRKEGLIRIERGSSQKTVNKNDALNGVLNFRLLKFIYADHIYIFYRISNDLMRMEQIYSVK